MLFKAALSISLVSWIASRADLSQLRVIIANADARFLAAAFSLYFVGYVIVSLRWRILLHAQGVNPPLGRLIESFAVSVFFNNILPSTVGGDLSRAFDSWRFGSSKSAALIVVVVDRFIGMSAMFLLAGTAFLAAPGAIAGIPALQTMMAVFFAVIVASGLFLFGAPRAPVSRIAGTLSNLPGFPGRLSKKLVHGVSAYWGRNRELTRALLLSLLLQLVVIVHFMLIAEGLDATIAPAAMFIVIPAILVVMMIPITINGIGVREAAFVYFFSFYGVGDEKALAMAWVQFGFVLLQGLLGGLVFLLRRGSGRSPAPNAGRDDAGGY